MIPKPIAQCARCEHLEEEVAYLKAELGISNVADDVEAIRLAFGIGKAEATLLNALYQGQGRTLSRWILLDILPTDNEQREAKIIDVYCSKIRRQIGKGAILNSWGEGYRLSLEGREKVGGALAELHAKRLAANTDRPR